MTERDLDVFIAEQNTIADLRERVDLLERQKQLLLVRTEVQARLIEKLREELDG